MLRITKYINILKFKYIAISFIWYENHNFGSQCTGSNGACRKTCASDELDCYMLDNNGFVVISESTEHTGR